MYLLFYISTLIAFGFFYISNWTRKIIFQKDFQFLLCYPIYLSEVKVVYTPQYYMMSDWPESYKNMITGQSGLL